MGESSQNRGHSGLPGRQTGRGTARTTRGVLMWRSSSLDRAVGSAPGELRTTLLARPPPTSFARQPARHEHSGQAERRVARCVTSTDWRPPPYRSRPRCSRAASAARWSSKCWPSTTTTATGRAERRPMAPPVPGRLTTGSGVSPGRRARTATRDPVAPSASSAPNTRILRAGGPTPRGDRGEPRSGEGRSPWSGVRGRALPAAAAQRQADAVASWRLHHHRPDTAPSSPAMRITHAVRGRISQPER